MESTFQSEAIEAIAAAAQSRPELFGLLEYFKFKSQEIQNVNREYELANSTDLSEDFVIRDSDSNDNTSDNGFPPLSLSSSNTEKTIWGPCGSDPRTEIFEYLESKRITYDFLKYILLEDQAKTKQSEQLFRHDSGIGIPLLRELWIRKDGKRVFEHLLLPIITKIKSLDHPLEVDPSRATKGTKSNVTQLCKLVTGCRCWRSGRQTGKATSCWRGRTRQRSCWPSDCRLE
eukprot:TRINITY_DN20247_c0_g1_i1.p1 TRINITY_DN20247_c0_g1~~TRINITY_DN20247_c0_g1_i1.p1  ORF type:complete len:231 (+),score=16.46 TRINITY_DN20247_c0_g1_i1:1-693(+)